jgi:hypothetical protein
VSTVQGELKELFQSFLYQYSGLELTVKVIFIPLRSKENLIALFDEKMRVIQQ